MKKIWHKDIAKPGWHLTDEESKLNENNLMLGRICKVCGQTQLLCTCNDEVAQRYFKKKKEFEEELGKIWESRETAIPQEEVFKKIEVNDMTKRSKILLTILCSWGFLVIVYIIVNVIRGWK